MKKISFITIILISILFSVTSCKKKNEAEPVPEPTPTAPPALSINSDYQSSFSLDGIAISYVMSNANFTLVHGSDNSINSMGGGTSTFGYDSYIGLSGSTGIRIEKGRISLPGGGNDPGNSNFLALFTPATIAYSPNAASGIAVTYWDGTTSWKSDIGTLDQTGSTFKIIDSKDATIPGFEYMVKVYTTFNCKLYDGNGNVKTLTNGVYIGTFAKI